MNKKLLIEQLEKMEGEEVRFSVLGEDGCGAYLVDIIEEYTLYADDEGKEFWFESTGITINLEEQ
jgi:hypothetical protein